MTTDDTLRALPDDEFESLVEEALKATRARARGEFVADESKALYNSPLADSTAVGQLYLTDDPTDEQKSAALGSFLHWALNQLQPPSTADKNRDDVRHYVLLSRYYFDADCTWANVGAELEVYEHIFDLRPAAITALARVIRRTIAHAQEIESLRQSAINDRLAALPDSARRLLELAAVLEVAIKADDLAALAGQLGRDGDAAADMAQLRDQRLLRPGEQDGTLVCDPKARQDGLVSIVDGERRRRYHRLAAAYFEQQIDYLRAVHHLAAAGQWRPAAALLLEKVPGLIQDGKGEAMQELLATFRRPVVGDRLWVELKVAAGRLAMLGRHVDMALSEYRQAAGAAANTSNLLRAWVMWHQAKGYQLTTELGAVIGYFDAALELLGEAPPADETLDSGAILHGHLLRFDHLVGRAWIAIQEQTDHPLAARLLARAEADLPSNDHARVFALHNAWAGLHSKLGNGADEAAHRHIAWRAAEATGDDECILKAALNLGQMYVHAEEYEKSSPYLVVARDVAGRIGDEARATKARQTLGAAFFYQKQFEAAVVEYLATIEVYARLGNTNKLAFAYADLAEAYGELHQFTLLRLFYERAAALPSQGENAHTQLWQLLDKLAARFGGIITAPLDEEEIAILEHVYAHGSIKLGAAEALGINKRTASRKLGGLVSKGLLAKDGARYVAAGGP